MNRNVRQGCPISALLYLFVLEILAFKLNHNSEIIGMDISNMIDDLKIYSKCGWYQFNLKRYFFLKCCNKLKIVEEFCKHTGSKVYYLVV